MKEFIKKNKFNLTIIFIYAIITFIILLLHECGRDEAQAWLISGKLNIIEMIKQITYEGHPMLWYLILHPFARLGFPYITTKIISWVISIISAYFILQKSPFDKKIKILFLCTSPMLYLYPSISRSYCLIPLAISITSYYYSKRHEQPIKYILSILLIANTHVVLYGMVGALLVSFYIEEIIQMRKTNTKEQKKKKYISLIIAIIGLIITIIPILISVKQNAEVGMENKEFSNYQINGIIIKIIITGTQIVENIFLADMIPLICIGFLFAYEIKYYSKNSIILLVSCVFHLFVHSYIYPLAEQRDVIFIFFIMFFYWIQKTNNKKNKYNIVAEMFVTILLLLNIVNGIDFINDEIDQQYSASKETANYINENIDIENSVFICTNMPYSSAVIPYVNKNIFWSPQTKDYFSYVTWNDEAVKPYTLQQLKEEIEKNFKDTGKNIYLLYTYDWKENIIQDLKEFEYIKEIFISNIAKRESYIIYKVNI